MRAEGGVGRAKKERMEGWNRATHRARIRRAGEKSGREADAGGESEREGGREGGMMEERGEGQPRWFTVGFADSVSASNIKISVASEKRSEEGS